MIADLKPYPEYKDSGLTWLGKLPGHWRLRRMKFLFSERTEKGFPDEPLLAATQSHGVVRKEDYGTRTVTATKDYHLLKLVNTGDFVISLRSFEGGLEVAHCRGIISPAYTVLVPRKEALRTYYSRFYKSPDFISSLTLFVTGIREGQNIDYERLSRAYMPLPSPEEQMAIGRFLDWANGRLERAIRAKRKVIALFNEQKQAIIHRAVTRGLDPSVPLKPSGIPWLGDIPQHWGLGKVKRFFRTCSGATPSSGQTSLYYNGPIPWIRTMDLNNGILNHYAIGITQRALDDTACKVLPIGSVLVAMYGGAGTIGKNGLLHIQATTNQALCALLPCPQFLPQFVLYFMQFQRPYWMVGADGTRKDPNISQDRIRESVMVLPPLPEQLRIVEYIGRETSSLQIACSRLEREIELLREYRTRLVADVVTGKLDVREAASRLPEDIEPATADDETDPEIYPEETEAEAVA